MSRFRNLRMLVGSLLLTTSLTACAVGPDYVAPKQDLAPFHNVVANSTENAPQLDRWWGGFKDPMLAKLVQQALEQNLDLAASIARVSQARAAAGGAEAALLPTADLGAGATFDHQSLRSPAGTVSNGAPGFKRDAVDYSVGPSASWEIDLFGGLRRGASAAEAEAEAAEAEHVGTRITVAADTADAYLQIRGYQARLAVALDQIKTDEHLVELVRNRRDAGAATDREIAQAEALLKQARATVPVLRIGLEQQMNRLDVLLGVQPGTNAKELGVVQAIPSVPAIPGDQQPTDMLRRRPDIIAAERHLAASNEQIGAAIADYYPKISLSGALGLDSQGGGGFLTGNALQATGGGLLRWRIFDFGKVDAEVAQAKGANAAALALYRYTVLHAAEDVENALSGLTLTQAHVAELQGEVDSLVKARDLAEQAYRAGSITLTDVLDADRQLLAARDQLDADQAGAARAAVGVFRAFGGGWEVPGASGAGQAS